MDEVLRIRKRGKNFSVVMDNESVKMTEEELRSFLEGKVNKMDIQRGFYQSIGKNYCELFLKTAKNSLDVRGKQEATSLLKDTFSFSVPKMRKKMEKKLTDAEKQGKKLHIELLPAGIGSSSTYKVVRSKDSMQLTWHYPYQGEKVHEEVTQFLENADQIMMRQGPLQEATLSPANFVLNESGLEEWKEETLTEKYAQGSYQIRGRTLIKQRTTKHSDHIRKE